MFLSGWAANSTRTGSLDDESRWILSWVNRHKHTAIMSTGSSKYFSEKGPSRKIRLIHKSLPPPKQQQDRKKEQKSATPRRISTSTQLTLNLASDWTTIKRSRSRRGGMPNYLRCNLRQQTCAAFRVEGASWLKHPKDVLPCKHRAQSPTRKAVNTHTE